MGNTVSCIAVTAATVPATASRPAENFVHGPTQEPRRPTCQKVIHCSELPRPALLGDGGLQRRSDDARVERPGEPERALPGRSDAPLGSAIARWT
jgi:hypothetical protein